MREYLTLMAGALLMVLAAPVSAQLYVTNYDGPGNGSVGKYDQATGAVINATFIPNVVGATGIALDGNGHLFVASVGQESIGEYDAVTGATINSSFITGLGIPNAIVLDGLGNLYVANFDGTIGKYNAVTGAVINASFISTGHPFGLAVDSQRRLYATNNTLSSVYVFDADTGAAIAAPLISGGAQGMEDPIGIVVDGQSHLFVANEASGVINEFDAMTGAVIDPSVTSYSTPWGLSMDGGGSLFVASLNSGQVVKYNATTGAAVFITGLSDPQFIAIAPEPSACAFVSLWVCGLLTLRRDQRQRVLNRGHS